MKTTVFISLEALAVTLGLPQSYLRGLATQDRIPFLNVNGRMRFNAEEVQKALVNLTHKERSKICLH
jgi:excisionase family DNA binding protein